LLDNKKGGVLKIDENKRILIQFSDPEGLKVEEKYDLSLGTTQSDMQELLNTILENKDPQEYTFFHQHVEVRKSLAELWIELGELDPEKVLQIVYHPQELFHVRPITRISSSLEGHKEAILDVAFSPNGKYLASVSGDKTLRFWDLHVEAPLKTVDKVHLHAVLICSWSPSGDFIATGDEGGLIVVWKGLDHEIVSKCEGHKKFITGLSWEPLHKNMNCDRLASSSKDMTLKIWNVLNGNCMVTTSMHKNCITKVLWGGQDLIYTTSEDRTIKVWDKTGKIQKDLRSHGHWVNCISCNTVFALRTGCNDFTLKTYETKEKMQEVALEKYEKLKGKGDERIVTGSDDCSLYMWTPSNSTKPTVRLLGHQQPVNHVQFSPNAQYIISASFDKSLRLWNGTTGEYLAV